MAAGSSELAVDVRDLVKTYPKTRTWRELVRRVPPSHVEALRGLTLSVPRGSTCGLLGANGAGKTTLLKALATLVLPTSGTASVEGHDVVEDAAAVRAAIGLVVAEERSFYWRLTGRQNLAFFAALHDLPSKEARARGAELLEVVGLADAADRPYREYSSGMRQRLSIARGLLASPRVLLMDEPTRALDPPSAAWIRRFVRERLVGERGTTVLLATHDLLEAETTCDRLALVEGGRVVAAGTPGELKRTLDRAARTAITLLPPCSEQLHLLLRDLAADVARGEDGSIVATVAGSPEEVADLVTRVVGAGGRVASVEPKDADLASLFQRLAARKEPSPARREDTTP